MQTAAQVDELLNRLHNAVWELTAVATVLGTRPEIDPETLVHAKRVLVELGLMATGRNGPVPTPGWAHLLAEDTGDLASQLAAPVLQCAALLTGSKVWTAQDDAALLAQSRASAYAAAPFKQYVMPVLEGLSAMLAGESPTMLDIGVGAASMAVEYCRVFPSLRVVGLDVFPRALGLARGVVDDAGMTARVELREQDVVDLEDQSAFALAWLPAPFVPRASIEAGLPRIAAALQPGGWLVIGHGKFHDGGLATAVSRFRTTACGGSPVDDADAQRLLHEAGLVGVRSLRTPYDAPGLTAGRRRPD